MKKPFDLVKVSDSLTINRYQNGWMVEITGRNSAEDWKTCKVVCTTEAELLDLIKQYNLTNLED